MISPTLGYRPPQVSATENKYQKVATRALVVTCAARLTLKDISEAYRDFRSQPSPWSGTSTRQSRCGTAHTLKNKGVPNAPKNACCDPGRRRFVRRT